MLNELSDKEFEIFEHLSQRGFVNIKKSLQVNGETAENWEQIIYEKYKNIHKEYVKNITNSEIGFECFERALFIQWYSSIEPAFLSGIYEVDTESEEIIIKKLAELIGQNSVALELNFMLCWYYMIADYYFEKFYLNFPQLKIHYEESGKYKANMIEYFKKSNFVKRGQMGDYLNSIDWDMVE